MGFGWENSTLCLSCPLQVWMKFRYLSTLQIPVTNQALSLAILTVSGLAATPLLSSGYLLSPPPRTKEVITYVLLSTPGKGEARGAARRREVGAR